MGPNGLPCAEDFFEAYDDVNYEGASNEDAGLGLIIGGSVNRDIREDGIFTCSLRVSCALNTSGLTIPSIGEQSTLIRGGSNDGTRALYDTADLHAFLTTITPPNATNQSTASTRRRLSTGQVAITIRPRLFTVDSDGNEETTRSGHAGVVVDYSRNYRDGRIPTSENDIWILETCPSDE